MKSSLDTVFQSIAPTSDVDDMAVMKQAIQYSGGKNVVSHQLSPIPEPFVACEDKTAFFISGTDELKEEIAGFRVKSGIAYFVNYQKAWALIHFPPPLETPFSCGLFRSAIIWFMLTKYTDKPCRIASVASPIAM